MNKVTIKNGLNIENMVYEIRGKQVMLDSDLAKLYGCKNGTKTVNLAVSRHINRFSTDYRFQLNEEEYDSLRFQFETANINMKRTLPYVFTKEGIEILGSILRLPNANIVTKNILNLFNNNELSSYQEVFIIKDLIYEIDGFQVMLDSDLANLFEVETKRINEAVKNNLIKFPERFCWKLTDDESQKLLVENFDQKNVETRGGKYKNPRVFTEQGIAMLATVLKSKVAIEVSIRIMDAFVAMRHFIGNNEYRLSNIETKIIEHDNSIKFLRETFDKFDEKKKINEIYFDGQIYDAYSKIQEILNRAKKKIVIVDAYADYTLLDIVKRLNVDVTIITKKDNLLTNQDILKYNKQYHNLKVVYTNTFHDRYFIFDDEIVYHCGASINRIGYKTFSINLISDKDICNMLITKVNTIM